MRKEKRKRKTVLWTALIGTGAIAVIVLVKINTGSQTASLPEPSETIWMEQEETEAEIWEEDRGNRPAGFKEDQEKDTAADAAAIEQEAERILRLSAGEMAAAGMVDENLTDRLFFAAGIRDDIFNRMYGNSFAENENIQILELSYLKMLYYGFDGNTYVGEMVVNQKIEAEVLSVFKTLYENRYPIERMVLIDEYQADDEASMQDNNTSAFNYRVIAGSTKLSNHSYGMAIDLNPKYNPYVKTAADGTLFCQPAAGIEYADRTQEFDYKIDENDLAYQLFTEAGFTWGGNFRSVKDYQHFEKN